MTAAALLDKLDGVRQVAPGRWRARCPAHSGENRNLLSIGETSDGTTLLRCFHGCGAAEIVHALGMELHDLFPRVEWQRTGEHASRPRRPRVDWAAMVAACETDLALVFVLLRDLAEAGREIAPDDRATAKAAARRVWNLIHEARQ